MQNLTITGRLIADAESKSTSTGIQIVEFTMSVVTEYKKGQDGYYPTQFYKVAIFGKQGEYKLPMLQKGVNVLAIGTPKYRLYNDKLYIDLTAHEVEILEKVEAKQQTQQTERFDPSTIPNADDVEIDMPF